jgi:cytochrome c-type biogenesis protein CcmH
MMSFLFWTLATALTAAALYSLLRPLTRRSNQDDIGRESSLVEIYRERLLQLEQQHQRGELDADQLLSARSELETSLALELPDSEQSDAKASPPAGKKAVPLLVGIAVPALAVALYFTFGMPEAINGPVADPNSALMPSIDEMVSRLEHRLQTNPDDTQGWTLLGRSYAALNRFEKSRNAYMEAAKRAPDNADILFSLTEVTAALQNNSLAGEPETFLSRGLQLDPQSRHGRWLQGILAYQQGDSGKAVKLWEQLLAESSNTREKTLLQRFIQQVKGSAPGTVAGETSIATTAPKSATQAGSPGVAAEAAGPHVTVNVRLADTLASKVSGNDTLFVYAKAAAGPPMPLAIVRKITADLPLRVTLNDSQAMMPQMKLSAFNQVIINARISKSGSAMPSTGDLQGISNPVDPAQNPSVDIVIDSVVP